MNSWRAQNRLRTKREFFSQLSHQASKLLALRDFCSHMPLSYFFDLNRKVHYLHNTSSEPFFLSRALTFHVVIHAVPSWQFQESQRYFLAHTILYCFDLRSKLHIVSNRLRFKCFDTISYYLCKALLDIYRSFVYILVTHSESFSHLSILLNVHADSYASFVTSIVLLCVYAYNRYVNVYLHLSIW